MCKSNVCLVGAIPSPIGGVSSYCFRLVKFLGSDVFSQLIDLYPSEKKEVVPNNLSVHTAPFSNGILKAIWLFFKIIFSRCEVFHFNFSSATSLVMLAFLPKKGRWVLTLHNGALIHGNSLLSLIYRFSLNKIDEVCFISDAQLQFYENYVGNEKLFKLDSYIPPVDLNFDSSCSYASSALPQGKYVVASGYKKVFYRFDFVLELARLYPKLNFVLVTYGDSDKKVEKIINEYLVSFKNLILIENLSESDFNKLLSGAKMYLRPNDIDSFGIACADSILLGTPVLASDVCERFFGCSIFETGNFSDFNEKFHQAINSVSNLDKIDIKKLIQDKRSSYLKVYFK